MRNAAFIVTIVSLLCFAPRYHNLTSELFERSASEQTGSAPLNVGSPITGWRASASYLDALLHIATLDKLPMGLVLEGKTLCTERVNADDTPTSIRELISQVNRDLPSYEIE